VPAAAISGRKVAVSVSVARFRLPDPEASARSAGLRYIRDPAPGIRRQRAGRGFTYRRPDGGRVRDASTLRRIRALAIPPAWRDVWIAPDPAGHLQAVGRDARGRKQYRYHPRWRAVRDDVKFGRMVAFAEALPAVRRRVAADLRASPQSREHVLATVVRLLERTLIRVGNDEYARANRSYGLTTLRPRHVCVDGARARFAFRAKGGIQQQVDVHDAALARAIGRCRTGRRGKLFQYVDADGVRRAVSAADVNAYLRRVAGDHVSAKDMRTWAGTVLAATNLCWAPAASSAAGRRRAIVRAVDGVAHRLGNTRAVCRASYIHPAILDAYLDGETIGLSSSRQLRDAKAAHGPLIPEAEAAVLALVRRRAAHAHHLAA
jgi:DNA topoisomerase-1